jgi:hypothetical protein
MDIQKIVIYGEKQGIDIILPYKKTGVNVIKNIIIITDNTGNGDFVTEEFQSVVIIKKKHVFLRYFSCKLKNGNQEVIITDGVLVINTILHFNIKATINKY